MSYEFLLMSSMSRNPITFDEFLLMSYEFLLMSSISRNPITFDEFLFNEFHVTQSYYV